MNGVRVDNGYVTPCLEWRGAVTGMGYGSMRHDGRVRDVHVVAWEEEYGPVPPGRELDHLCRIPLCFDTTHLEAVTHAENMRRGSQAKLTAEQARTIRLERGKVTQRELAERFGVSVSLVKNIHTNRAWVGV